MSALAPFIRIVLRYLSAALIAKGYFGESDAALFVDEELIGAIVAGVNEGWYFLARKYGWEK